MAVLIFDLKTGLKTMAAPKGNQNAVRGKSPKSAGYRLTMTPENLELLKKIASAEKITIAQVLEKSLLKTYPELFSDKF